VCNGGRRNSAKTIDEKQIWKSYRADARGPKSLSAFHSKFGNEYWYDKCINSQSAKYDVGATWSSRLSRAQLHKSTRLSRSCHNRIYNRFQHTYHVSRVTAVNDKATDYYYYYYIMCIILYIRVHAYNSVTFANIMLYLFHHIPKTIRFQ